MGNAPDVLVNINRIIHDPDGSTVILLTYYDNANLKVDKEYRLSSFNLENFKAIVRSQIQQFKETGDVGLSLHEGPFDPAPTITPPTDEEQKRIDYAKDVVLWRRCLQAIQSGVLSDQDKLYTETLTRLLNNFIVSYIDLF